MCSRRVPLEPTVLPKMPPTWKPRCGTCGTFSTCPRPRRPMSLTGPGSRLNFGPARGCPAAASTHLCPRTRAAVCDPQLPEPRWQHCCRARAAAGTQRPLSLTLTHACAAHDAILVGIGAVPADDPRLTVRLVAGPDPQPIIVDGGLRLPPTARLLQQHPAASGWRRRAPRTRTERSRCRQTCAFWRLVPAQTAASICLRCWQTACGGYSSVMVEGGSQLLTSFMQQHLAQAAVITITHRASWEGWARISTPGGQQSSFGDVLALSHDDSFSYVYV